MHYSKAMKRSTPQQQGLSLYPEQAPPPPVAMPSAWDQPAEKPTPPHKDPLPVGTWVERKDPPLCRTDLSIQGLIVNQFYDRYRGEWLYTFERCNSEGEALYTYDGGNNRHRAGIDFGYESSLKVNVHLKDVV